MKSIIWHHGPPVFWAVLIFVVSSIPSLSPPDTGISMQDKLAHGVEYGIFGFLIQRSICYRFGCCINLFFIGFGIGMVYGGLDEIHQLFIPGRQSCIEDFIADTVGVFAGQGIFWLTIRKRYFLS